MTENKEAIEASEVNDLPDTAQTADAPEDMPEPENEVTPETADPEDIPEAAPEPAADTAIMTAIVKENPFTAFVRVVIALLLLIFMGILTMTSFLQTTGMEIVWDGGYDTVVNRLRVDIEAVIYYSDNIPANFLWLAVTVLLCCLAVRLLKKLSLKTELLLITVWTLVLGFVWVHSSQSMPTYDSAMVTNAAASAAQNDFSFIAEGERYFRNYSFQLGYVFFNEMIVRITEFFSEPETMLYIEYMNIVFLALTYIAVILIIDRIFSDKRIRHISVLLLALSIAPIMFSTFIYGIIPGTCFAVWAVYLEIRFLAAEKLTAQVKYGLLSAICLAVAVMIKSNNLIVLVAVCAIAFTAMFSRKRFIRNAVYIAVCAALAVSINPAVKGMYESRSGEELGDAIPFICWFDLGFNEGISAPGWYNFAGIWNFEGSDYKADLATENAVAHLKDRIGIFNDDPQYRNDFFYRKFVSQWNETSYQSIWTNKVRDQYKEKTALAKWVCNDGRIGTLKYMDILAQFIFLMTLFGCIRLLRDKNLLGAVLPLIILGGMLYHLLAEAKSQYALPYYILMTAFAPYGFMPVYERVSARAAAFLSGISREADEDIAESTDEAAQSDEVPAEDTADENDTAENEQVILPDENENTADTENENAE